MKRLAFLIGLAGLAAASPAAAAPKAPPARDWSATVTAQPSGAYVIGNPQAKVKLVEYMSLTCPHCAHFSQEGMAPLKQRYLSTGQVSLELRHALRDPFDLAASLLARCGGPAAYLPAMENTFARQGEWMGKAMALPQATMEALNAQPAAQRMVTIARETGLGPIAARGVPPARQQACLVSPVETKRLAAQADEAWQGRKIPGTPAFFINGQLAADVHSWAELDAALGKALGRP